MPRCRHAFLAACLLAGAVVPIASQTQPASITIAGRVLADATDQPVRRAFVVLNGAGTRTVRLAATDRNGTFQFDGLPADTYRVGASKRPYLSAAVDAASTGVVIRLHMGAAAFGVVLNETGQPARDVMVTLSGTALSAPRTMPTDVRGEYRIHGLPAGEYQLETSRSTEPRRIVLDYGEQLQVLPLELRAPTLVTSETPPTPLKPGTGSVGGRVLDVRTNQPLAGIAVNLGRTGVRTVTDSEGRFRIAGLPAGFHALMAQHPGYFPLATATVLLADGAQVSDVTLRIGRHGTISGVVRDDVGDPVVGMPVQAFRKAIMNFQPLLAPGAGAVTDDRGAFRLDGLMPGDYLVCASANQPLSVEPQLLSQLGPVPLSLATITRQIDDTVLTYPPTYHPGRTRGADAQIVTMEYGDDRFGIDITMYGVKPFAVSGQLSENGSAPLQGMAVVAVLEGDLPGSILITQLEPTEVSANGAFRIAGVPPGRYLLSAFPAKGSPGPSAVVPIQVDDRDVSGLVLALGEGASVRGRIEFAGRSRPPDPEALSKTRVGLTPLEMFSMRQLMISGSTGTLGNGARPDANGRFTITKVTPGQYGVSVIVPGGGWNTIESVRTVEGGVSLDALLTVGPDGADDVVITVSDAPLASVHGTAVLDRYESPGSARVVVFPTDRTMWTDAIRYQGRFVFGFVERDSTFRFDTLPPGEYFIALIPGSGFEMSTQHLERWSRTAQRVRLRGGEAVKIEVKR